jgi:hypothetical protein
MTTTPEQIEAALAAFAHASGLGIFPDDEKDEAWDEDLVDGMRAAISAMRPIIRAEALEEAAKVIKDECYDHDDSIRLADIILKLKSSI